MAGEELYAASLRRWREAEDAGPRGPTAPTERSERQPLVVTKLVLEVDSPFGAYSRCSVKDGAYVCDLPDNSSAQLVGREDIRAHFAKEEQRWYGGAQRERWDC